MVCRSSESAVSVVYLRSMCCRCSLLSLSLSLLSLSLSLSLSPLSPLSLSLSLSPLPLPLSYHLIRKRFLNNLGCRSSGASGRCWLAATNSLNFFRISGLLAFSAACSGTASAISAQGKKATFPDLRLYVTYSPTATRNFMRMDGWQRCSYDGPIRQ